MFKQNIILIFFILSLPFSGLCQHWQGLGLGMNGSVSCFYPDTISNTLYVGGNFNMSGGITTWGIAKWNGFDWDSVGQGLISCAFPARAIIKYNNEIYAGGFTGCGIAKWNGSYWSIVGGGVDGPVTDFLVYDNELYVCGDFDTAGTIPANGIAKWNGSIWSDVHELPCFNCPNPNLLSCMAFYQDELYVGGNFYSQNGINMIVKWNGTSWQDVGGGFYGSLASVGDLVEYKGKLYASGTFSKTENINNPGNYIAAWDGSNWSDVGGGVIGISGGNGQIHDLIIYHDELYAVGVFSYAVGIPAQYIAKWDGSKWCGFGSLFDNRILSLGIYQDMLYIGGGFITIDSDTMNYIAKWTGGSYVDTCGNATGIEELTFSQNEIQFYPNPFSNSTTLQFLKPLQNATFTIFDMLGKKVKCLQNLNGTEIQITNEGLKSGMYFFSIIDAKGFIGNGKFIIE